MSKKHCMFQLWLIEEIPIFGYGQGKMVEDTELITWEEAVNLWNEYKPKVIEQLYNKQDVEMCIWTGCKDKFSYTNEAFRVNSATQVENGEFVEVITKPIDPNTVIMPDPIFEDLKLRKIME